MVQLISKYELAPFFKEMQDLDEGLVVAFTNDILNLYIHDICRREYASQESILTIIRAFIIQTAQINATDCKIAAILPAIWY